MSAIQTELRLIRLQIGELARVLAQPHYPYDPVVTDEHEPTAAVRELERRAKQIAPFDGDDAATLQRAVVILEQFLPQKGGVW